MSIPIKHIEFIQAIAKGAQQGEAYRTTIGNKNTTQKNARVQGCKLAKKYTKEIEQARENKKAIIEHVNESDIVKTALKEILTEAQVDAELCKIVKGEPVTLKVMTTKGFPIEAELTPTIADRLKAIDIYYDRFGSNAPTKLAHEGNVNSTVNILFNEILNEDETTT